MDYELPMNLIVPKIRQSPPAITSVHRLAGQSRVPARHSSRLQVHRAIVVVLHRTCLDIRSAQEVFADTSSMACSDQRSEQGKSAETEMNRDMERQER
jgi:hypothetical protein